jgi:hypothetical protein
MVIAPIATKRTRGCCRTADTPLHESDVQQHTVVSTPYSVTVLHPVVPPMQFTKFPLVLRPTVLPPFEWRFVFWKIEMKRGGWYEDENQDVFIRQHTMHTSPAPASVFHLSVVSPFTNGSLHSAVLVPLLQLLQLFDYYESFYNVIQLV